MTKEEYLAKYILYSPTIETNSNRFECVPGVTRVYTHKHVLVSTGALHLCGFFEPINNNGIEKVGGKNWELFSVTHEGEIAGVKYYWGMFVEGAGFFNVQAVQEHCRELLPQERAAWSKKTLGMYGSHSGNLSYTLPSGVQE